MSTGNDLLPFLESSSQDEGDWCEGCQSLREELTKVQAEHALNYTTLKEKIISTDLLIKKYTSKCQECDLHLKKTEELNKKLEQYRRDCELLESRLKVALQEVEPLKKTKERLELAQKNHAEELAVLTEKLEISEASNRIYIDAQAEFDLKTRVLTEQIQALKKSNRKQEAFIKKLEANLAAKQANLREQKKRKPATISNGEKLQEKLAYFERTLSEHGLLQEAVRVAPKGLQKYFQSNPERPTTPPPEPVSSDEELLLEKLFCAEEGEAENVNLFRPIGHALSPLPPSPPSCEEDGNSSSEDDSVDDLAGMLESALKGHDGQSLDYTEVDSAKKQSQARPRRSRMGGKGRGRRHQDQHCEEVNANTSGSAASDSQVTRLVESGLSTAGVLTLQESFSDPEVEHDTNIDDVPFQGFNQEQKNLTTASVSDISLSASSTSESESESSQTELSSASVGKRSLRRRKRGKPVEVKNSVPERRRTRSMSQDSSSGGESPECGAWASNKDPPKLSTDTEDASQIQQMASPFKEPLPVSPRRSRRRTSSMKKDARISPQCLVSATNTTPDTAPELPTIPETRRITRSLSSPDRTVAKRESKGEKSARFGKRDSSRGKEQTEEAEVIVPAPTRKRRHSVDKEEDNYDGSPLSNVKKHSRPQRTINQQEDGKESVQPQQDQVTRALLEGSTGDDKVATTDSPKESARVSVRRKAIAEAECESEGGHNAETDLSEENMPTGTDTRQPKWSSSKSAALPGIVPISVSRTNNLNTVHEHGVDCNLQVALDGNRPHPEHRPLSKTSSTGFIIQSLEADAPEEGDTGDGKNSLFRPETGSEGTDMLTCISFDVGETQTEQQVRHTNGEVQGKDNLSLEDKPKAKETSLERLPVEKSHTDEDNVSGIIPSQVKPVSNVLTAQTETKWKSDELHSVGDSPAKLSDSITGDRTLSEPQMRDDSALQQDQSPRHRPSSDINLTDGKPSGDTVKAPDEGTCRSKPIIPEIYIHEAEDICTEESQIFSDQNEVVSEDTVQSEIGQKAPPQDQKQLNEISGMDVEENDEHVTTDPGKDNQRCAITDVPLRSLQAESHVAGEKLDKPQGESADDSEVKDSGTSQDSVDSESKNETNATVITEASMQKNMQVTEDARPATAASTEMGDPAGQDVPTNTTAADTENVASLSRSTSLSSGEESSSVKVRATLKRQFSVDAGPQAKDVSDKGVCLRNKFQTAKQGSLEQSGSEESMDGASNSGSSVPTVEGPFGSPESFDESLKETSSQHEQHLEGAVKQSSLGFVSESLATTDNTLVQPMAGTSPDDVLNANIQREDEPTAGCSQWGMEYEQKAAVGSRPRGSQSGAVRPTTLSYRPTHESSDSPKAPGDQGLDTPELLPPSAGGTPTESESRVLGAAMLGAGRSETPSVTNTPSLLSESPMSSLPPSPMEKVTECLTPLSPMLPSDQSEALSPLSFTLSDTEDIGDPISPLPPSPVPSPDHFREEPTQQQMNIEQASNEQLSSEQKTSQQFSRVSDSHLCPIKDSQDDAKDTDHSASVTMVAPVYQPKPRLAHRPPACPAGEALSAKGKATTGMPTKSSKVKRSSVHHTADTVSQEKEAVKQPETTTKSTRRQIPQSSSMQPSGSKPTMKSDSEQLELKAAAVIMGKVRQARISKRKSPESSSNEGIPKKLQCASSAPQVAAVEQLFLGLIRQRRTDVEPVAAQLLGKSIGADTICKVLLKVCCDQEIDLLSTLYAECSRTTQQALWQPFMANHEVKVTSLILHLESKPQMENIFEQFFAAAAKVILAKDTTSVLVRVSLCRICAALCRQKGAVGRLRVLLYDVIVYQVTGFPTLTLGVASVWPQVLQHNLIQGPQTMVEVLEYVVMKRVSCQKIRHTKLAVCLKVLCQWAPPSGDSKQLVHKILNLLQDQADKPQPDRDLILELEQSLVLVACTEDWMWTNNVLVVDLMWPRLRAWAAACTGRATSDVSDAMSESLIRMMGHIASRCPAEHSSAALDVIGTLYHLVVGVPGASIPPAIQEAALVSLLRLAPFGPEKVVGAANAWLQARPTVTWTSTTATTTRRVSLQQTQGGNLAPTRQEAQLRSHIAHLAQLYAKVLPAEALKALKQ